MAYSIENIKSQLVGGGARNALFKASFTYPDGVGERSSQKLEFMCKASSGIPQSTITPIDVDYMGRKVKVAGSRPAFPDWTLTVINDEDFLIRNDLEKWMNFINGHVDNQQPVGLREYKTEGYLDQLSKDGSIIRRYTFKGIFPTNLAEIALDWSSEEIQKFDVTFAIDWWEVSGKTSDIEFPKGQNV